VKRSFTIRYYCSSADKTVSGPWTSQQSIEHSDNCEVELIAEFSRDYKADTNFRVISVIKHPSGSIDWELKERMDAIRQMCDLGNKARADISVRKRQPFKSAYVLFADRTVQDFLLASQDTGTICDPNTKVGMYLDRSGEYERTLAAELNVDRVEFVDSPERFFNIVLKPNFRSLGPKGYGKLAQKLKDDLLALSFNDRASLYRKLDNGQTVDITGIPITISDVEIEYSEQLTSNYKQAGFVSCVGKVGALILNTEMTQDLLERGMIADFRAAVQIIRKDADLLLTDKINLNVYCGEVCINALEKGADKLCKDLLATKMTFHPIDDGRDTNKILLNNEVAFVALQKEISCRSENTSIFCQT